MIDIINNTYFKNEIYIPHARPSISDSVQDVQSEIVDFIREYSRDCLVKCFGLTLFLDFESRLDDSSLDLIGAGEDVKWSELMNGKLYNDPLTDLPVQWKGIRYKSLSTGEYDKSFLANYVYFFYEKNDHIVRSEAGDVKLEAKNAQLVGPTEKVVKAWRKFYEIVQGDTFVSRVYDFGNAYGVDYFIDSNQEVSLYKFITDMNTLAEDTYPDFNPKKWENINRLGL